MNLSADLTKFIDVLDKLHKSGQTTTSSFYLRNQLKNLQLAFEYNLVDLPSLVEEFNRLAKEVEQLAP